MLNSHEQKGAESKMSGSALENTHTPSAQIERNLMEYLDHAHLHAL